MYAAPRPKRALGSALAVTDAGVRRAADWSNNHPGNRVAESYGRRNPITRWAEIGAPSIYFPHHHLLSQWSSKRKLLPKLGRLGDEVDFASLPSTVSAHDGIAWTAALRRADWSRIRLRSCRPLASSISM